MSFAEKKIRKRDENRIKSLYINLVKVGGFSFCCLFKLCLPIYCHVNSVTFVFWLKTGTSVSAVFLCIFI